MTTTTTLDPHIAEQFEARTGFPLEPAIVMLCLVGSDSHNTKIPNSNPHGIDDTDFLGVYVPPPSYTLGVKAGLKHAETVNFQYEELDCVFYSLRRFVELLLKSNPNVLGTLWLRPEHYVLTSPEWDRLMAARRAFSSRASYPSFSGYAYGQAKKMESFDLKTQLEWELAMAVVQRAGYTKEQIGSNAHREMPRLEAVAKWFWYEGEDSERLAREQMARQLWPGVPSGSPTWIEYATPIVDGAIASIVRIHARHFQGYMGDKRKQNVIRYGYDVKNAAHLIRLMRMCVEFLGGDAGGGPGREGEFEVYRTWDADDLRGIKQGAWTLEAVKAEASRLDEVAKAALAVCSLPEEPDREAADRLLVDLTRQRYGW
jgi:hypothetical protein